MSKIWTVLSGELTQGLHLNTNGKVTGTPRELVSSVIIARVTDSESGLFNDREIRVDFGQSIQDLAISTASIPHSHVDVPYSYTLGATGGAVPYKWEITSGEIPAGINLSRNGIISGTSLTSYLTPVVIQVEDRYGSTESSVFNLQSVVTMAFQTQSIANGYEQAEYIQPVIMTGGYQNQYEISAGSLPTGLMINNSTGSITGTPTIQGNYTFTVRCYDSLGHDVTREFTVPIYAEQDEAEVIILEPIEMTEPVSSSLLTEATEYSNYTYTLSVTGGTAPYIWTLISGSLPTGLNLHSSGIISGIPSGQGLVTFTLRATDSADPAATDDQVCSIQVNENPRYRTVNGITAGSVVIDTPAGEYILINPSLFARKLYTNSPVLGTPTGVFIRIMRYLTADNYTLSAPVLGQPAGEYHLITRNLSATGITTGAAILGSPVCIRPNDILVASSLSTGSPVIGSPVMVRRVNLTTSGITTGIPVLTNVIAHTLYTLNSVSLTCGAVILPSVTCGTGYPLSAQSITTGAVVFAAVSAGTTYSFTATQLTTGAVIIQTPLTHTSYSLNTGNMACGNVVIGTPAAGTGYSLSASVLTGGIPVIGSPSLETSYSVTPTAVVAGSVVLGTPVPHTSYEMSATVITTGQIVTGNPVLSEGQILYAVDLATGQFVLGTPQLVHHVSMTANNLIIGQPVMGSPQMTRIIALTANGLAASSPVLGSPVLDIPILITATGQYFSPILQVADGATVQWTFSDGTTSSSLTNDIDFGTNATRTHQLKVTPWSALQDLNLRYCGGDGGSSTEPNSAYTPTHGLNYDSPLLSRVVNILNLNLAQTNLQVLCISYCTMTSLDVSGFSHLWRLESYLGSLVNINLEGCVAMRRLCLEQNNVTALDISDCSLLEDIRGAGNAMPTIIWPETAVHLWHECLVSNSQFTPNIRIDFPNVQELWVSGCNLQGNIVIPSQKLRSTWLYFNNLDSVDFSSARFLSGAIIEASSSNIETVIFGPGCSALDEIDFRNNNLTAITGLQYLTAARRFRLDNNDFSTAQIDEILKHVDTIVHQTYNNDPGEWYNTRVTLTGNNPPSQDGMEHARNLIAKGWYVTYDAPAADINLTLPHISIGSPYLSLNDTLIEAPANLISFYPCDETTGNVLHASRGARDLTLYNNVAWDTPGHNRDTCWTPAHGGTTTLIDENLFLDGGTIAFWAYFLPSVGAIIHWPADWNNYHIYYNGTGELAGCGTGWGLGSSVGWVHVAIVFQTGQNLCYRNGELVYVLDDGPGRNRITNPFNLLSTANNANVFPAYVSDLHIWNRPCTHQEVLNCMNAVYIYDAIKPDDLVPSAPVLGTPSLIEIKFTRIINNNNYNDTTTQTDIDLAKSLNVYFEHASVGGNVSDGLTALESSYPIYDITQGTINDGDPAWYSTNTGFGHINRGNPGEYEKITYFTNTMDANLAAAIDVATYKFCYIDSPVSATDLMSTAQTAMETLENTYPNVIFVWWTMPITDSGADAQRNAYNNLVRQYCISNDKWLIDIADIEAHDPDGVEQLDGNGYQLLYTGYTSDGGHLNAAGQLKMAYAVWTLLTNIRKYQLANELATDAPVLGTPVLDQVTLPVDLLSIYKCNETSGNVLHDTLNRWDRTLINTPAWTEDGRGDYTSGWYSRSNNAFSDPVDPPTGYNFDNGITMAFWASVLPLGVLGAIFRMTENQFHFTINNGYIGLNGAQTWQDTQLQVGDWHHIAISYSDTITGTVYLDGIVLGTFSPRAVSNFVFGAYSGGYSYPAIVNDIHIWNKVCTQTEIQNCMNQIYINGESPVSITADNLVIGIPVLGAPIIEIIASQFVRIIDHTNFDDTSSQEDIDLARQIDMYFEHASVGGNVINGLIELESNTPIFNITTGTVTRSDPTWFGTNEGIGEINRGNPGEYEKIDYFNGSITAQLMAAVDVATHKFCYIDTPVSATDLMAAAQASYEGWEALYPNVIFLWWTMPITSSGAQAQRDIYNDLVRQYCQENNKFLFDIADIEAHDPSGVEQLDGNGYQLLYIPYTDDGGHLNATGRVRVARAMWTLLTNVRKFQIYQDPRAVNLVTGSVVLGTPVLGTPDVTINSYPVSLVTGSPVPGMPVLSEITESLQKYVMILK